MFTKPIDEITFEDVKYFCEEWTEGVRVEYKRELEEIKGNIPKIVSSFANTHGGTFFIGVKADKIKNEVIFPIQGIPKTPGIEEQIQQSALTGVYPAVIPKIKLVDVPNSGNVIVVVHVDESVQAPHAIEDSTKVYFRVGSVSQPYELKLANMELIAHMFKRREDSQIVARQILDRIEERISNVEPAFKTIGDTEYRLRDFPTFTVIVRPVFPYRPVISVSSVYESHQGIISLPRQVTGGSVSFDDKVYWELNEYGIVYHRVVLPILPEKGIDYRLLLSPLNNLIKRTNALYVDCAYQGNIEVTACLQKVFGKELVDTESDRHVRVTGNLYAKPICFDQKVLASKHCLAHYLVGGKERGDIIEELICQLLWAFNIPIGNPHVREKIRKRIEWELS